MTIVITFSKPVSILRMIFITSTPYQQSHPRNVQFYLNNNTFPEWDKQIIYPKSYISCPSNFRQVFFISLYLRKKKLKLDLDYHTENSN